MTSICYGRNTKAEGRYQIAVGNNITLSRDEDYAININYKNINIYLGYSSNDNIISNLEILHIQPNYRIDLDELIKLTKFLLTQWDRSIGKLNYKYMFFHTKTKTLIVYYKFSYEFNHTIINQNYNQQQEIEQLKQENKRLMDSIDSLEFILKQNTDAYLELKEEFMKIKDKIHK
jgi:hypothetical protein